MPGSDGEPRTWSDGVPFSPQRGTTQRAPPFGSGVRIATEQECTNWRGAWSRSGCATCVTRCRLVCTLTGPDGSLRFANEAFRQLVGEGSIDEWIAAMSVDLRDEARRAARECRELGTPFSLLVVRDDGAAPTWLRRRGLRLDEGWCGGTLDDVTEMQRTRDAAEEAQPRQERVPGQHEPRDPHADERHHRHDRPAAATRALDRRRSASTSASSRDAGESLLAHHQRHPRLLEDRGRASSTSSTVDFDLREQRRRGGRAGRGQRARARGWSCVCRVAPDVPRRVRRAIRCGCARC